MRTRDASDGCQTALSRTRKSRLTVAVRRPLARDGCAPRSIVTRWMFDAPSAATRAYMEQRRREMALPAHFVSVHIRWGDKVRRRRRGPDLRLGRSLRVPCSRSGAPLPPRGFTTNESCRGVRLKPLAPIPRLAPPPPSLLPYLPPRGHDGAHRPHYRRPPQVTQHETRLISASEYLAAARIVMPSPDVAAGAEATAAGGGESGGGSKSGGGAPLPPQRAIFLATSSPAALRDLRAAIDNATERVYAANASHVSDEISGVRKNYWISREVRGEVRARRSRAVATIRRTIHDTHDRRARRSRAVATIRRTMHDTHDRRTKTEPRRRDTTHDSRRTTHTTQEPRRRDEAHAQNRSCPAVD